MLILIHRILTISWLAPLRRFAYTVAVDPDRFLTFGIPQRQILRASGKVWSFGIRADRFVSNLDRTALMAATRRAGTKIAAAFAFRLLARRNNFVAAVEIADEFPFSSYSVSTQISIIFAGFNGVDGLKSDLRLTELLGRSESSLRRINRSSMRLLIKCIRVSGLSHDEKLAAVERLGNLKSQGRSKGPIEAKVADAAIRIRAGESVELPKTLIAAIRGGEPTAADFIYLRTHWTTAREWFDHAEIVSFLQRALTSTKVTVEQVPFVCRELKDDEILEAISEDRLFMRLADFPQVFNFRTGTPRGALAERIVTRALSYWFDGEGNRGLSKFDKASVEIKNQIIGVVCKADRLPAVADVLDHLHVSDTLLDITYARAYLNLMKDEHATAMVGFESILRQDPGNPRGWTGLQWVSVRATGELDRVKSLRREIGRGVYQSGRPVLDQRRADGTLMTSRQWTGNHERIPLATLSRVWLEVQEFFGDRWYDFSRFPAPDKTRELLAFARFGVGDEVREAYHFSELASQFKHVTIVCDPRLLNIFRSSFADITFVPYARRDKPGFLDDKREDPIKEVPAILANYLPDAVRDLMLNPETIITMTQNFVGRRLANHDYDLREGGYLTNGSKPVPRPKNAKKRVGILWRSHLTRGFRGLMYLSFEDIKPLFDQDDVEFVSLQHMLTDEERAYLDAHGVEQPDVDLYNDFEGISELVGTLDLVVGLSTFPIEFAAALGCPIWLLGHSPENFYLRTLGGVRRKDILTANSTIVAPDVPRFWQTRQVCIDETLAVVRRDLAAFARP